MFPSVSAFRAPVLGALLAGLGFASLALSACDESASDCAAGRCEFTAEERDLLNSIANLPPLDADPSNKYSSIEGAQHLGQKFYFDPGMSGTALLQDFALKRPVPYARAAKGQDMNISCATCHNPARAGTDFTSVPNFVSIGAGWYDVNGEQTVNSGYYKLLYWNGRTDNLWSQAAAVTESFVSMNGNRMKVVRRIHDFYAAEYAALFPDAPIPVMDTVAEATNGIDAATGQCKQVNGACPANCVTDSAGCWPRFPLQGKPGASGCDRSDAANEPFHDAWDCMDKPSRDAVNKVFVNYAKAIAAYEGSLISRNAPFDKFMAGDPNTQLSAAAIRGAKLFVGKASCIECHNTPLLTDQRFHNIGLPPQQSPVPNIADCVQGANCDCVTPKNCLPWGWFDGLGKLQASNTMRRDGPFSDNPMDASRAEFYTLKPTDEMKGTWRTPSLRDVALTPPYMHSGIFNTLEEVINHYWVGGSVNAGQPGTKDVKIRPLDLEARDVSDLVAFLQTLTGEAMPKEHVTAPADLPPLK